MSTNTSRSYGPARPCRIEEVPHWDIDTHVAVIGFGAAGSCAAIEARGAGAAVHVFEVAAAPGGSDRAWPTDELLAAGVDPPGQLWEDYRHATDELVMLIVGRLELEFGGRCLRPVVGEEIQIPAGVSHTVRNIGGTTAQWLYGYWRMQTG